MKYIIPDGTCLLKYSQMNKVLSEICFGAFQSGEQKQNGLFTDVKGGEQLTIMLLHEQRLYVFSNKMHFKTSNSWHKSTHPTNITYLSHNTIMVIRDGCGGANL